MAASGAFTEQERRELAKMLKARARAGGCTDEERTELAEALEDRDQEERFLKIHLESIIKEGRVLGVEREVPERGRELARRYLAQGSLSVEEYLEFEELTEPGMAAERHQFWYQLRRAAKTDLDPRIRELARRELGTPEPAPSPAANGVEGGETDGDDRDAEELEVQVTRLSDESKAKRIVDTLRRLDDSGEEWIPRARLKPDFGIPATTVDRDADQHAKDGDRKQAQHTGGITRFRKGYVRDFVSKRWKPKN